MLEEDRMRAGERNRWGGRRRGLPGGLGAGGILHVDRPPAAFRGPARGRTQRPAPACSRLGREPLGSQVISSAPAIPTSPEPSALARDALAPSITAAIAVL
jgi:hypothetical protein